MAEEKEKPKPENRSVVERMASVVGHEIRNPLAVINNSIYFVKAKLQSAGPVDDKVAKHLGIIESEVQQANSVVSEMLSFSRKLELRKEKRPVDDAVSDVLAGVPPPEKVKVDKKLGGKGAMLEADPDKLKLALGHILRNAYDAMPAGGTVTLATSAAGGGIEISVADTGEGIPASIASQIFEPFITSKPRGVGLGLTLAKRIVEAHGGSIDLSSSEGKGTTVKFKFPAASN
jgi:signal transduction histidine kinase